MNSHLWIKITQNYGIYFIIINPVKQMGDYEVSCLSYPFSVMLANNRGMFYIIFMYIFRQYKNNSSISFTGVFQTKEKCYYFFI